MTKEEKFTNIALKQKRLSYLISSVMSLLNILLLLQSLASIWGIPLQYYIQKPELTREALMQYEIYIRYLITISFVLLTIDSYVFQYYRRKHGINPPRWYGVCLSFYLMFVFTLAYYLYQIWTFLYFALLGAGALTYYLTLQNPYLEELSRSKFIKTKENK